MNPLSLWEMMWQIGALVAAAVPIWILAGLVLKVLSSFLPFLNE